uniref:SDR family oxidoreductase n=1 Tax=Paractinoplanes polyasparticus TaxID=2856853 RepID=UPI001C8570D4|nr:SDR family oxidoreductase [Actinoplanes polyasparticus]
MSVVLITGAGSGIGRLTARRLADDGHTVYASMRDVEGRNSDRAAEVAAYAAEHRVQLRTVELDVLSQESADAAVSHIVGETGHLDVVVHNAAHLYYGITEAFSPEQFLQSYDTNVVGALRVNRAALPVLRRQGQGLLLWVGSGTSRVVPPFLSPYTAAKAAMDSLADSVSLEVAPFGIETSIVMPGPFTVGTEHFPNAAGPAEPEVSDRYDLIAAHIARNQAATEGLFPPGVAQDVNQVATEIARIVALPHSQRPYRSSVDFSDFGDLPVTAVATAQRERLMHRMGFTDLLRPTILKEES